MSVGLAVQPGLVRLALWRSASGGVWLAALALALLLPALHWAPSPAQPYPGVVAASGEFSGGLLRQGVWASFLAVVGCLLVVKSAATVAGWRRGEVDWLATARSSRLAIVLSDWLGKAAGAALLLALAAVAAELRTPGGPSLQQVGQVAAPRVVLAEPDAPVTWQPAADAALRPGPTLRAVLVPVGGGATADVRFAARRGTGPWAEVRGHLARRTALALVLPDAPAGESDAPLELVLERTGPGAIVVLDGSLEWLAPTPSVRRASLVLFARAWLALASACALALGLGAWVRPGGAAGLVFTLAIAAWGSPLAQSWWPGYGLGQSLTLVREGLVPAPPSAQLAGFLGVTLLGLALAVRGLRDWRHPP